MGGGSSGGPYLGDWNSRSCGRGTRLSAGRKEEEGLPEIPEELSEEQRQSLQEPLDEFRDMFVGKDFRLGSTGVVEHEIHTHGPPIR